MRPALLAVCAGCVVGAAFALPGVAAAKPMPRCGANEVSRTVVYVRRKGGHKRRVTGCVPRSAPASGGSVTDALAGMRKFALTLAPASLKRKLRTRAAKRLLAADVAS